MKGVIMSLKQFALFCFFSSLPVMSIAADYSPTAKDIEAIDLKTGEYFAAMDAGKYDAAYAMLTKSMKELMSLDQWSSMKKKADLDLGKLLRRSRTNVTWYQDPQDAPAPGLYVAVDFESAYLNSASHTEYVIWYRFNDKEEFKLMRHEVTFMLKQGGAAATGKTDAPIQESTSTSIVYKNVEEARKALMGDSGNVIKKTDDGWLVVQQPKENTVWSFSPPGHPSYPSVIKRFPIQRDGKIFLGMSVICEANKTPCDALVREFQEMNKSMAKQMQAQ